VCRWVRIRPQSTRCLWTRDLDGALDCPIAHGEGRFVSEDLAALEADDLVAFRYESANPNGSMGGVAGICDESGRVLGLMPHPENHVLARQSPWRHRSKEATLGLRLFKEGVRHAR
jgi:phosphoribosylformylglycinamidine synthase